MSVHRYLLWVGCVIGGAAAFVVGFLLGADWGARRGDLGTLITRSMAAHYAAYEYQHGDTAHAETALRDYLVILDRTRQQASSIRSDNTYWFDRMLSEARLATLRERAGDPEGASKLTLAALESCRSSGRSNCSEEYVRTALKQMDALLPLPEAPSNAHEAN